MKTIKVAEKDDIPCGQVRVVEVNGQRIAVYHVDDEFYAISDLCTHAMAYLSEGGIEGIEVICPKHGGRFDVRNGKALSPPAMDGLKSYVVHLNKNDIMLEV